MPQHVFQEGPKTEVVMFPVKDILITAPRNGLIKMVPFTESIEAVEYDACYSSAFK